MSPHPTDLLVADLMTRAVHTLTPEQSLPLAESMMGLLHVRHIPVVNAERHIVGLVTHRDLLAAKLSALSPLSATERASLELAVPVSRLMKTDVWTISARALALNAVTIMREHRFGCLPVVDDGALVGIITEADLLALVTTSLGSERPTSPTTIAHVMTPVPVTIGPETPVSEARETMTRFRINHLPVVQDGKPVGLVSERDVIAAEALFKKADRTPAAHVARLLGKVRMHQASAHASLATVLREMARDHADGVVVVDAGGRLVGIFTATDACRVLAEGLR